MRRIATLSFAALLACSAMPALQGPASAGVRLPKDLIELTPDLMEMMDTAIKIATNDIPSIVSEDIELSEYGKRVAKVHFGHAFPKEPMIQGNQVFSPDPDVRANARNEYADFVSAEAKDLECIKVRQNDRAAALKTYEQIYKRYAEFANKAPDLIDAAGKANNYAFALEIANRLHAAEFAKPDLDKIVTEYRRLIKEYDDAIGKTELEHDAHVSGLKALDAVMPPKDYRPPATKEQQAKPESGKTERTAPSHRQPNYADRLRSAVTNSTASSIYRADQVNSSIEAARQRIGPARAASTSAGTSLPFPGQGEPTWTGTITTGPQ